MNHSITKLKQFRNSKHGNFAINFAIILPVLLGAGAGGLDFMNYKNHKSQLQAAADAAAIAAAREASLKGWNEKSASSIARAMIASNLGSGVVNKVDYKTQSKIDLENRRVVVTISQDHYPYFAASMYPSPQIEVSATASSSGNASTCVIVSETSDGKALEMKGDAFVRANGCVAYSNSEDSKGISTKNSARLISDMTCSAGGYEGSTLNYKPLPVTRCPAVADPLQARGILIDADVKNLPCDHNDKQEFSNVTGSISPGVYCGELKIKDNSKIELLPGIYVFRNAKFKVEKNSSIIGKKVGFVLTGKKAALELKHDTKIGLSAPETGPMAGILVYAQPVSSTKKSRKIKIESKDAKQLIGTVYLPNDTLTIGGDEDGDGICDPEFLGAPPTGIVCDSEVGDVSAWTAIVARKLKVTNGARLVINSNYDGSTVPVPTGIGPTSGPIRLVQ